jgi:hypothetical protein
MRVIMETTNIRQKLHQFIDTIEDKKAEAIYTLFEDEIEQDELEYTEDFKDELDKRYEYYQSGGEMITAKEAGEQIGEILQLGKKK